MFPFDEIVEALEFITNTGEYEHPKSEKKEAPVIPLPYIPSYTHLRGPKLPTLPPAYPSSLGHLFNEPDHVGIRTVTGENVDGTFKYETLRFDTIHSGPNASTPDSRFAMKNFLNFKC